MLDYSVFTSLVVLARVAAAVYAVNANAVFYFLRNKKARLSFHLMLSHRQIEDDSGMQAHEEHRLTAILIFRTTDKQQKMRPSRFA